MVSNSSEQSTMGVDLGGTKAETSLVDANGRIVASHRQPTDPEKGVDAVIADVVTCVVRLKEGKARNPVATSVALC